MALETGTFVDDLVTTNPPGTDAKSQGDDHLRLLKTVLKNTFTNSTRAFRFPEAAAAKTGAYTVVLTDQNALVRGDATGGAFTVTLPLLSNVFAGFSVTVMKSDSSANAVTVDGNGAETINGTTTRTLYLQYDVEVYMSEGTEWKVTGHNFDESEGADVASATTTEIWSATGSTRHITGTTTITSLGTALRAGQWQKVIFDGVLTLTDGANLNLPGAANITTAADDFAWVYAETTTLFKVLYFKEDGTAVVVAAGGPSQATQAALEAETDEDTYPPPDLIKHSPGVAKVLVKWEQTGAHGILASYNMDSVTDGGGAGDTDHLWTTDFSSAEYITVCMEASERTPTPTVSTFLAGGVTTVTRTMDSAAAIDRNHNSMAIFGDQ